MTRNQKASNDDLQRLVREAVEQAVKAALEEPIREMKAIVEDLKKELEDVKLINKQQGDEIATLKLAVNDLQQGKRIKYLRVFGIGITEAEVKESGAEEAICKKVYDKLLVPVLQGALGKGFIRDIPTLWNTLSCGYMSGKEHVDDNGRTIPPPLVVKFNNKETRDAVLRCKKEYLPTPSTAERAGGIKRFSLVEDLTRPTHQLFRNLVADERVGAVWTVDGRIRFTLSGDKANKIFKAPSPFTSVDELLKKK
jgi:hypothetical protein